MPKKLEHSGRQCATECIRASGPTSTGTMLRTFVAVAVRKETQSTTAPTVAPTPGARYYNMSLFGYTVREQDLTLGRGFGARQYSHTLQISGLGQQQILMQQWWGINAGVRGWMDGTTRRRVSEDICTQMGLVTSTSSGASLGQAVRRFRLMTLENGFGLSIYQCRDNYPKRRRQVSTLVWVLRGA